MKSTHSLLLRTACVSMVLAMVLLLSAAGAAPKLVKPVLNVKAKTLYVGSDGPMLSFQLEMLNEDPGYPAQKSWRSSKPDVATVDQNGLVTPIKKGSANIVLTLTESGKTAKAGCKIKVKSVLPTSVYFDRPRSVIAAGDHLLLNPTVLPSNAVDKEVSYKSSNPAVATISKQGEVVGVKQGKATISCTTATGKKKTSISLIVTPSFNGAKYRFFGIGNANYQGDSKLNGCKTDLSLARSAFQNATYTGQRPEVTAKLNLTGDGIRSLLAQMALGAGANDVTVFYYSGHGMSGGKYNGALCGIDWDMVTVDEVRRALDRVPGKVVVLLDCCLSGQYISSRSAATEATQSFNDIIKEAFSSDPIAAEKALTDSPQRKKYKIITASGPHQSSYVSRDRGESRSVFTEYMAEGLGIELSGQPTALAADKNKDSVVTLAELFGFIDKRVRAYVKRNPSSVQTTMVWPRGDAFAVLARS